MAKKRTAKQLVKLILDATSLDNDANKNSVYCAQYRTAIRTSKTTFAICYGSPKETRGSVGGTNTHFLDAIEGAVHFKMISNEEATLLCDWWFETNREHLKKSKLESLRNQAETLGFTLVRARR